MTALVRFWALWLMCTSAFASSAGEQLFEGNAAYRSGEYTRAESVYRALLDEGVVNGHVLYNLGNSFYRQGRSSEAMLAWRRAQILMPRDPDIQANLARARDATRDRLPALINSRDLFFWQRRLSPREGALTGSFLVGMGFVVLGAARWRRKDWRLLGASISLVGGVVLMAALDEASSMWRAPSGIVLDAEVSVRSAVSAEGVELFQLHAGAEVRLKERTGEHVQIELADGRRGWLSAGSVGSVVPNAPFPVL